MKGVANVGRVLPEEPYATYESNCALCRSSLNPTKLYFVKGGAYRKTVVPNDYNVFYVNLSEDRPVKGEFHHAGEVDEFVAHPGQLIGIVPSQEEQIFQLDNDYWQAVLCVHQSVLNDKVSSISKGQYNAAEVIPAYAVDSPLLCSAMREIEQVQTGQTARDAFYLESLYEVVMAKITNRYTSMKKELPSFKMHSPGHVKKVLNYIFENLDKDVKVAELAAMMDLSPYHFTRIFKEYVGASPYQYILNMRYEKSKELLQESDMSLVAIAHSLGFSSQSHFQSFFKKQAGVTPKDFRRSKLQ